LPDGTSTGSAIGKAIKLLDALADTVEPMSMKDLGNVTGLPKPSAHRMLSQLEEQGLVERNPMTKFYTIGRNLGALSIKVLSARVRLPDIKSIMQKLTVDIGETVNLAVLDGSDVVYIERVESSQPLRMNLRAGSRIPVHTSSTGKVLAAHLPKRRRERLLQNLELKKYTEFTITNLDKLTDELAATRKRGYSISYQEYMIGLIGVGVPIKSPSGEVIAALALHAPEARMSLDIGVACVPRLNEAASLIGEIFTEDAGHMRR
tara:strand:- start:31356 stop:32141 length:786 start_codon:yes stop_codon:yes gene_type:complete